MKRIILFRFHKEIDLCINRIKLITRFNPHVDVYGIWGGAASELESATNKLSPFLHHIFDISDQSPEWKWMNGDIAMAMWFREIGKHLSFDVLHLMEWDLVVLDSLENVYGDAGKNGVALTALTPIAQVPQDWFWTNNEPWIEQWRQLQDYVKSTHNWSGPYYACQGPANVFSRNFLERYSSESIPTLVHDELRLPLFAQALGFEITPLTHIHRKIKDSADLRFFNCDRREISRNVIRWEMLKQSGRRVFHPYTRPLPIQGPLWLL